ncbi:MAG TPA: hypothetical protein VMR62_15000 [Bryobacteraceae bacterium]|jgi:hypothetical protein|nr:hypothetical protein [Bryobacteraceae bacterium]
MIAAGLLFFLASPDHAALIQQAAASGRALELAVSPSERLSPAAQIAPGAPPLLSFRFFEGKQRHRFGDLDLVIDDAGH